MRQCFLAKRSTLVVLVLLAGCGGGGGGGGGGISGPQYAGNTNAAVITEGNASRLTVGAFGGDDTATALLGLKLESSSASSNPGSGLVHLARSLNRSARDAVLRFNAPQRVVSGAQIDQNRPCDGNIGSVRTSGMLLDGSLTGTLMVDFIGCLIDGVIVNGPATLRVDAFNSAPTDSTLSFEILTIRGPGVSVDARGSLHDELDLGAGKETVTIDLVTRNNNNSGKTSKSENLKFVYVYDNILSPSSFTASVSGRLFDHDHGFVDISTNTLTLLFFNTFDQFFPDSGQILLTGSGNRSIRATALSTTLVRLDLDLDGNSMIDRTATLKWTDLTGPIGVDLRDADGDGMHNSWETVYGLSPGDPTDAAGNPDMDAFNNLAEYQNGTNPNVAD